MEFLVDSVPELQSPFDVFRKADANRVIDHFLETTKKFMDLRSRTITKLDSFDDLHALESAFGI